MADVAEFTDSGFLGAAAAMALYQAKHARRNQRALLRSGIKTSLMRKPR